MLSCWHQVRPEVRRPARHVSRGLTAVCLVVLLAGCQVAAPRPVGGITGPGDDGTTLTMWTRSLTSSISRNLVDGYNRTHRNQVKLTVMPTDSYQQRIGAAAGANQLPDLLAVDVVYAPNYASKGVFRDLTEPIRSLPFWTYLAPSHIDAATYRGRMFAVPHDIDIAALFYNKELFTRAGLDGDRPPQTLAELHDFARKINELGSGVHGYNFGGACPDCMAITTWPMVWASGATMLNAQGTVATIDNSVAATVYQTYRQMYAEGLVPRAAKNESGPTWTKSFAAGVIGMQPMGATALQTVEEGPNLQIGVAPIPGVDGGASSFVGGDVLGIPANSKHPSQAWDFVSWTVTEAAQVDVLAKHRNVTVRDDLADNVYAQQDPRLNVFTQLAHIGQTPTAVNFGKTFNDPNGPWISAITDAIFGTDDMSVVLGRHNPVITASLSSR